MNEHVTASPQTGGYGASAAAGAPASNTQPAMPSPAAASVVAGAGAGTSAGTGATPALTIAQPPANARVQAPAVRGDRRALVALYWHLSVTGFLAFAGFAAALLIARMGGFSDLLLLVLMAGSTGAVINNYYRLAKLSTVDQAVFDQADHHVFTMQIYVSLLVSAVLGIIMYGLCLSGLIAGDLFPAFKGEQADYTNVTELMRNVSPAGNIDAAKAVVWTFIAGFSEKLIPNMIDRMADKAAAREQ